MRHCCDIVVISAKCDMCDFNHQVELFVRGLKSQQEYKARPSSMHSPASKRKHKKCLRNMASATGYACKDMEPWVRVGYDLAQRKIVSFTKAVGERHKFYVVWEKGVDVDVVPYEEGSLLPFKDRDERLCLKAAYCDDADDAHYLFEVEFALHNHVSLISHLMSHVTLICLTNISRCVVFISLG